MVQLFTNNAESVLDGAINDSVTTINLTAGTGVKFPSPTGGDFFHLTISNADETLWEIVKVTARSTDALTVVRAQDNTTALSWISGSQASLRITAADASSWAKKDTAQDWTAAQHFQKAARSKTSALGTEFDWSVGGTWTKTFTATTFTFTEANLPASDEDQEMKLRATNLGLATGITWPATWEWEGGLAPDPADFPTSGKSEIVVAVSDGAAPFAKTVGLDIS